MSGLSIAFTVVVQIVFWFTLVFAIAERAGAAYIPATGRPWTPDDLPELPAPDRLSLGEAIASVAFGAFVLAAIVWVQVAKPIVIDGTAFALFDPAVSVWLWYLVGLTLAEIVFALALYRRGRWTWAYAVANAVLAAALAIPVVWLIREDLLLNPALVDAIDAQTGGNWLEPTMIITAFVFAFIAVIDSVDGFRKAWRTSRQAAPPVG